MSLRRVIASAVIVSVVLVRAVVLEGHPPPPNIEGHLIVGAWLLTPVAFLVSMIIFLGLGLLKKTTLSTQIFDFLWSVIGWTVAGFGIASVIIIGISAYYNSPQGPFSIIFLDGPLGAGVGTVVGFIMWLANNGKNRSIA
jgi:hypothetical protein